jgi:methyl-accepting chemotaxis protein
LELTVHQALAIGGVVGIALGGLAMWWWSRTEVRKVGSRVSVLEGERDRAVAKAGDYESEVAELTESMSNRITDVVRESTSLLGERGRSLRVLDAKLAKLLDAELPDDGAEGAKAVLDELGARNEAADRGLDDLNQRVARMADLVATVSRDDPAWTQQTEQLVEASTLSVEAATSVEEVINKIAESANETKDLSIQVSTEAERGYRAVHRTLDEIERIRDLAGVAGDRIGALGQRVEGIGAVVGVIHDITEKTNLLALNASIIAAQAGKHGKSFAIVAREIKALAQQTAASTKEITEQIRGVQSESERATSAMSDGVAAVGEGFQVAIAAGDALDAIRRSARTSAKRAQSMSRTVKRQNVSQQVREATLTVAERSTGLADNANREINTTEQLRASAEEIQSGTKRISSSLGEHRSTSKACTALLTHLLEHNQTTRDADKALRERVSELRDAIAELQSTDDEVAGKLREL